MTLSLNFVLKMCILGLLWRLSGKESACQRRRHQFDHDPGTPHMPRSNQAHGPQLLRLLCRIWELQLLKPTRPRACALQQEMLLQRDTRAPQGRVALLPATGEEPKQQ